MAHQITCADAVTTTVEQCKCQCKGAFHGGPHTERFRGLIGSGAKRSKKATYAFNQRDTAFKIMKKAKGSSSFDNLATGYVATRIVENLVNLSSFNQETFVEEFFASLYRPFSEEIFKSKVKKEDKGKLVALLREEHIFCTICVVLSEALDKITQYGHEILDELVDEVMDEICSDTQFRGVIKVAVKASIKKLIGKLSLDAEVQQSLRIMAVLTCPNTNKHQEVENCANALSSDILDDQFKEWINSKLPEAEAPTTASSK